MCAGRLVAESASLEGSWRANARLKGENGWASGNLSYRGTVHPSDFFALQKTHLPSREGHNLSATPREGHKKPNSFPTLHKSKTHRLYRQLSHNRQPTAGGHQGDTRLHRGLRGLHHK
ncbi:MAG: hypothetical protein FD163_901 [Hyphomonadaceae bacterium]|nr:MAG: hypothetical protein FD163_901 [Hyphomonadaceae bacterium]